jgi:hypothetical protein
MANPFSGIISSDLQLIYNNAINALLESSSSLSVPCRFVYEGTNSNLCPNCYFDYTTGRSSNTYVPGGPISFNQGQCPYCRGVGKLYEDSTEDIYMMVVWNYKDFVLWNIKQSTNLESPEGLAQTISAITTMDNVMKASYVILDTNITPYETQKFKRYAPPNPAGLGTDSFILTLWERIQ